MATGASANTGEYSADCSGRQAAPSGGDHRLCDGRSNAGALCHFLVHVISGANHHPDCDAIADLYHPTNFDATANANGHDGCHPFFGTNRYANRKAFGDANDHADRNAFACGH